jgi:hypothetical protein
VNGRIEKLYAPQEAGVGIEGATAHLSIEKENGDMIKAQYLFEGALLLPNARLRM